MHDTKLLPRHLMLLALPVVLAMLGGYFLTGNLQNFMGAAAKGISQAELFFAISFLCASLAFSWRHLPSFVTWGVVLFFPLVFTVIAFPQLGEKVDFIILSLMNIVFAAGVLLILRITFFYKKLIRMRTALFSIAAAALLTAYMKVLYTLLKQSFPSSTFINALFLFIFIGFGLSLADIIIIRMEIKQLKGSYQETHREEEEDDL